MCLGNQDRGNSEPTKASPRLYPPARMDTASFVMAEAETKDEEVLHPLPLGNAYSADSADSADFF